MQKETKESMTEVGLCPAEILGNETSLLAFLIGRWRVSQKKGRGRWLAKKLIRTRPVGRSRPLGDLPELRGWNKKGGGRGGAKGMACTKQSSGSRKKEKSTGEYRFGVASKEGGKGETRAVNVGRRPGASRAGLVAVC